MGCKGKRGEKFYGAARTQKLADNLAKKAKKEYNKVRVTKKTKAGWYKVWAKE